MTLSSLARLRSLAGAQAGVFTRQQALGAGYRSAQIDTLVRRGEWRSCGFGCFAIVADCHPDHVYALDCAARVLRLKRDVVISHASAALLLGIPHVAQPARPTATLALPGAIGRASDLLVAEVPPEHRHVSLGLAITTGPRTLVDLLRTAPDALVAQGLADGGLSSGITRASCDEVLAFCAGWPGIAQARTALEFGEPRCENPLESRCRIWFRDGGLPAPTPQKEIRLRTGRKVRADFCFEEHGVIVEADGRVKYGDEAPWRRPSDEPLWDEKRREDALRDLGFEVVRAVWADGKDGGVDLVRRVRRAMERAAERRGRRAVG